MSGIAFHLTGASEAIAYLDGMVARLDEPAPMWDAIGAYGEASTVQRFLDERAPDGSPWPASLRVLANGGVTLSDSGRLRQSITHNVLTQGVEWGSNLIYAAIQQEGGTITAKTSKGLRFKYRAAGANKPSWATKQSVTLPPRPFLGLDEEDMSEIILIAEQSVEGSLAHH